MKSLILAALLVVLAVPVFGQQTIYDPATGKFYYLYPQPDGSGMIWNPETGDYQYLLPDPWQGWQSPYPHYRKRNRR